MAEGNPYMQLCRMMGDSSPAAGLTIIEGKVTQLSPLVIKAAELELSGAALRVSAEMVSDKNGTTAGHGTGTIIGTATVTTSGSITSGSCSCEISSGSISGSTSASGNGGVTGTCETTTAGTCHIDAPLELGDTVLMLTMDQQVFYVLAKVVSA